MTRDQARVRGAAPGALEGEKGGPGRSGPNPPQEIHR